MCKRVLVAVQLVIAFLCGLAPSAADEGPSVVREALSDAWWTGPMLANSPATLPRGHFLLEPYLYDVVGPHSNGLGSRSYVLYGLADTVSVGGIPYAAYNLPDHAPKSAGLGFGDQTLLAQYRLTQFHPGSAVPTVSLNVQETFPTGKYDQLGRLSDGLGGGVFTTTLSVYSQTCLWLGNGRIVRIRLDASEGLSGTATIRGVSVYGTDASFHGQARPGNSLFVDNSYEYSATRRWVAALDVFYLRSARTLIDGYDAPRPSGVLSPTSVRLSSPPSSAFGFAPAVEYSWTSSIGVLIGVRVIPNGHNTTGTVTPAIAINYVH